MDLSEQLPETAIATRVHAENWRQAVTAAGQRLVAAGATTDAYTDQMIAAVEEHGPYIVIAPGFALAHARPSEAVLRTGISWVSLAEPIAFGHAKNDPVSIVVGLAARDHDGHLKIMSVLAGVLAEPATLARLAKAPDPTTVREILRTAGQHSEPTDATPAPNPPKERSTP